MGNRQKRKNSVKKTKPTPKKKSPQDATYKRALFQSPDQKLGKGVTQTPNSQGIHQSKRNLFVESSGEKEVNGNGKRERPMVRRMSPRKRVNRSLSFQDSGPVFPQPTSSSVHQNVLSGAHKQKMLWAATNALRDENMGMNHDLFRPCMSVLFKACQTLWLNKMLFNQEGSTSENMLKLTKRFSVYTIKEISSDPTSNHMALVCSNIIKMAEKTLDCVKSKVLSATPKLKPVQVSAESYKYNDEKNDSPNLNKSRGSVSKSKKGHVRLKTPVKGSPTTSAQKRVCEMNSKPVSQSDNNDSKACDDLEKKSLDKIIDTIDFNSPLTRSRKTLVLKNTPTKPFDSGCIDGRHATSSKLSSCPTVLNQNEDAINSLETPCEVQLKIPPYSRKTPKKNVELVSGDLNAIEDEHLDTKSNYEPLITRSKTLQNSGNTPKKVEINPAVTFEIASSSASIDHIVYTNTTESPRVLRSRTPSKYTPTKPAHLKSNLVESQDPRMGECKQSQNSINISPKIMPRIKTQKKNDVATNIGVISAFLNNSPSKSPNLKSPSMTSITIANPGGSPLRLDLNLSSTVDMISSNDMIGQTVETNKLEQAENVGETSPRLTRSRTTSKCTSTKPVHSKSNLGEASQKQCTTETKQPKNSSNLSLKTLSRVETPKKYNKAENISDCFVLLNNMQVKSPIVKSKTNDNPKSSPIRLKLNYSSPLEMSCSSNIVEQMGTSEKIEEGIENVNDISHRVTRSRTSSKYTPTKQALLKSNQVEESSNQKTKLSDHSRNVLFEIVPTVETPKKNVHRADTCVNSIEQFTNKNLSAYPNQCISENEQPVNSINLSVQISPTKGELKRDKCKIALSNSHQCFGQNAPISSVRSKDHCSSENIQQYHADIPSQLNAADLQEVKKSVAELKSDVISPVGTWKVSNSENMNSKEKQSNIETSEIKVTDSETKSLDTILSKPSLESSQRKSIISCVNNSGELKPSENMGSSPPVPFSISQTNFSSTKQKNCSSRKNFTSTNKQKRLKGTKCKKNIDLFSVNSPQPDLISPTTRSRKSQASKNNTQKTTFSGCSESSTQCDTSLNIMSEQPENKLDSPDFISPRTRLRSYDHRKVSPTSSAVIEGSVVDSICANPSPIKQSSTPKQRTKRFRSRMLSATKLKISKEFESPLKNSDVSSIIKSDYLNETSNTRKTPSKVRFNLVDSSRPIPQSSRSLLLSNNDQIASSDFEVESNSPEFTFCTTRSRSASLNEVNSLSSLECDTTDSQNSPFSNLHSHKKIRWKRVSSDSGSNRHSIGSEMGIDANDSLSQPCDQLENKNEIESETNKENLGSVKQMVLPKLNVIRPSSKHLLPVETNVPQPPLLSPTYNASDPVQLNSLPGIHFEPPTLTAHWTELSEGTSESECPPSLFPHWENSPGSSSLPDSIMTHWQNMPNKITSDKIMFDFEDESYEINLPSDDDTTASSVCAPFDFPLEDSRSGFPIVYRRDSRDSFQ